MENKKMEQEKITKLIDLLKDFENHEWEKIKHCVDRAYYSISRKVKMQDTERLSSDIIFELNGRWPTLQQSEPEMGEFDNSCPDTER